VPLQYGFNSQSGQVQALPYWLNFIPITRAKFTIACK